MQRMEGLADRQVHVDDDHLAALRDELIRRVAVKEVADLLPSILLCIQRKVACGMPSGGAKGGEAWQEDADLLPSGLLCMQRMFMQAGG